MTFETEAAIQRVVSHGSHRLRGSTVAIDIAMPKVEEEGMGSMDSGIDSSNTLFNPSLGGLMGQRM